MSTPRVLSPRALQELLRGNHNNFISVQVGDEVVHRIHRSVAKRFSLVWKSALEDPRSGIVTVTFPPDPPAAPPVAQPGPSSASAQESAQGIPPPAALAANKLALKFVVQWIEEGGADPSGNNAVPCPTTRPGVERLLALAEKLEIRELADRLTHDLGRIRVRRPKRCEKCKNAAHPGQECQKCWHCEEVGHRRANCPKAYQEYLEREERRRKRAEWEQRRQERQEAWQKKKEEREARTLQEQIRRGQVAVGDAGKIIYRW